MITISPSSGLHFKGRLAIASTRLAASLLWLNLYNDALAFPDASVPHSKPSVDASAASPSHKILPASEPLDLLALDQLKQSTCSGTICSSTQNLPESPTRLSNPILEPSLWWYRDQAKTGLIENWLVYEQPRSPTARVDFVLNRGVWSAMDYLDHYAFINTMGSATSRLGYSSRFFNLQQNSPTRLATYTCDFQQQPAACQLVLESIDLNRFR